MKLSTLLFEVPEFINPLSRKCLKLVGAPGNYRKFWLPNIRLFGAKLCISYYWKKAMLLLVAEVPKFMPLKGGLTPKVEGPTYGDTIGFDNGVDISLLFIFSYFLKADMLSDRSLKSLLPLPLIIWLDAFLSWFRLPSVSSFVTNIWGASTGLTFLSSLFFF